MEPPSDQARSDFAAEPTDVLADVESRSGGFAGAQRISVTSPLGTTLRQAAVVARQELPETSAVCVAVMRGRQVWGLEFDQGGLCSALDERQYPAGYGPCLSVARTGSSITIAAEASTGRHEDFRRLARRHGINHIVSLPLMMSAAAQGGGSLTAYGESGRSFDRATLGRARSMSSEIATLVSDAVCYWAAVVEVEQIQAAMRSRATIEQAKGIIMASRGCTAEAAFSVLQEMSSRSNRKLRDIATGLIEITAATTTASPSRG